MADGPVIMIVGTDCPSEWEESWNDWYTEKHLPDMFYTCNVRRATRYRLRTPRQEDGITPTACEHSADASYPPYVAVYEFDSWDDVKAYYASEERSEGHLAEWNKDWVPRGARTLWRAFYEPIKTWRK